MGVSMAIEKPWDDWPDTDIEAGWYVKNEKIFKGYSETEFRPNENITQKHFYDVLFRAKIIDATDTVNISDNTVTISQSQIYMPGTAWTSKPTDLVTRYRMAVMVYRHKNNIQPPNQDQVVIDRLEKLFQDKPVTWQGVTRKSKLIGHAKTIVEDSRKYGIPIWLCLGQGWRESQWYTTGLSIDYNCGWGMKDTKGWGEKGTPEYASGFANYVSIDESIHAYFRLMSSSKMPYKSLIDAGEYREALEIYSPDGDIARHYKTVMTVKSWCEERGIR